MDRADRRPLTAVGLAVSFWMGSCSTLCTPEGVVTTRIGRALALEAFFGGCGVNARRSKQVTTDPIASPQGSQGEISIVTDATNDEISSAM